jgi:ABC-type multidrug transport system ATPase subunit
VQIAVTKAARQPVLIRDDPTASLDPQRRKRVWDILRALNAAEGTTIIFITHDAVEAERIIHRVAILHAGRLVALGTPAALKQQVDRKLRLELAYPPDRPPALPPGLPLHDPGPGRTRVTLDWAEVPGVLAALDPATLDDFRLSATTLEDLYLHYATDP